jgi:hypothetical protein
MSPLLGIAISAGLLLTQIPLPQSQSGIATGIIRGLSGEPAAGVRVGARALTDSTVGIGEGALVSLTQTDVSGRYRLENIPPGRYYIQAGLVDFPTYYPGVAAMNDARSIQITPGALIERLDFTLARSTGARISGRIPLSAGRPVLVALVGRSPTFRSTSQIKPDGTFEFLRVPPGNYTLSASPANGLPSLNLVVDDKDIDVGMPAGPGVKVSGTIGLGPRSPRPPNQKVVLIVPSSWGQWEAPLDAEGKFELPNVPPGTYSLRTVPGALQPQASVVVADRDLRGVQIPGFVELSGVVALQDGQKFPTLSPALMIQATPSAGAPLATAVRSDGSFRFPLVEGEYRISFGKLPAGLSLKSIAYGSTDLLTAPLKLDGAEPVREIFVTMESQSR